MTTAQHGATYDPIPIGRTALCLLEANKAGVGWSEATSENCHKAPWGKDGPGWYRAVLLPSMWQDPWLLWLPQ